MAEAIPEYNITGLACCNFHTCIIILDQTIVCSAGTIGLVERGTSRHVDENGPHCGAGESFALPGNSGLWRSGHSAVDGSRPKGQNPPAVQKRREKDIFAGAGQADRHASSTTNATPLPVTARRSPHRAAHHSTSPHPRFTHTRMSCRGFILCGSTHRFLTACEHVQSHLCGIHRGCGVTCSFTRAWRGHGWPCRGNSELTNASGGSPFRLLAVAFLP
jgi:hypothetical protein